MLSTLFISRDPLSTTDDADYKVIKGIRKCESARLPVRCIPLPVYRGEQMIISLTMVLEHSWIMAYHAGYLVS